MHLSVSFPATDIEHAYAAADAEWEFSEDAALWEKTSADGFGDEKRPAVIFSDSAANPITDLTAEVRSPPSR